MNSFEQILKDIKIQDVILIILIVLVLYLLFRSRDNIPIGMIMIWSGTIDTIPKGWELCDGGATITGIVKPDLRSLFVIGASNPNTDLSKLNLTSRVVMEHGGEEKHTLTIEEIPSHTHPYMLSTDNNSCGNGGGGEQPCNRKEGKTNTGGSKPHNVMPPFIALAYIIKIE